MHQSNIEQAQEKVEELRRELRSEVEEEVRSNLRRRTWRRFLLRGFGCCGAYIAALLAVPALLAYLVAMTGLIEVPFLSSRVAHERAASRVVAVTPVDVERLLSTKLRAAFKAPPLGVRGGGGSYEPIVTPPSLPLPQGEGFPARVTVTLTESELSGLLRSALGQDGRVPAITMDTAQVAIAADGMEFFARVVGYGNRESTVLLHGVPTIQDGKVAVAFRDVAIGSLGVPRALANAIARSFLSQLPALRFGGEGLSAEALPRSTEAFREGGAKAGPLPSFAIERITLADGAVHITLKHAKP